MLCTSIHTMYILIGVWLVPGAGGIYLSEIIKNVSSLSGNLLNDLCYYVSKNLSVKSLSSTWNISVFITICSLEIVQFVANLAMITAPKCSGPSHAFRCVVEKNKNVIHQPRSVRIEKTRLSVLSTQVSWVSKTAGTVFPNTDLSAGEQPISNYLLVTPWKTLFELSRVKLHTKLLEGKWKLVRVSERFELWRVRVTESEITVNVWTKSTGNRFWFELARVRVTGIRL